ncbi:MAG: RHS repeat domain-containing protein, partial [Blastocatellia bacterium]
MRNSVSIQISRGTGTASRSLAIVALLLATAASAGAQAPTDSFTPSGLQPGSPTGSYPLSGFDTVNLYNGNLDFHLPLLGIGGRGTAGTKMMLGISQKWQVRTEQFGPDGSIILHIPTPSWWGPSPGYGPGVMAIRAATISSTCYTTLDRLTFTANDGTEYEFRDLSTQGQVEPATCSLAGATTFARGPVWVTADGTSATFIASAPIPDVIGTGSVVTQGLTGTLKWRDGTSYAIADGRVTSITDRNGNVVTFQYDNKFSMLVTAINDSLGRNVTIVYADFVNSFSDMITYNGFGGAPRTITVNYASSLDQALRPDFGTQLPPFTQLFPGLDEDPFFPGVPGVVVVSSLVLPNGQDYKFQYDYYGELARVVLPTGGAIEYDYTPTGQGIVSGFEIMRRVVARRSYKD